MIIDGKKESALLREEIKKEISLIKEKTNKVPRIVCNFNRGICSKSNIC